MPILRNGRRRTHLPALVAGDLLAGCFGVGSAWAYSSWDTPLPSSCNLNRPLVCERSKAWTRGYGKEKMWKRVLTTGARRIWTVGVTGLRVHLTANLPRSNKLRPRSVLGMSSRRAWSRKSEPDSGRRDGSTKAERDRVNALTRESRPFCLYKSTERCGATQKCSQR